MFIIMAEGVVAALADIHLQTNLADKHYVVPSQDRFDAAVLWLGKQYGQVC